MRTILLLNGPNLNLLGHREPALYGSETLPQIIAKLTTLAQDLGFLLTHLQSNHEGVLIDSLHQAKVDNVAGVIINPGALSHTSIALRDAITSTQLACIEVHISNIYAREPFRHHSYLAEVAKGTIAGLGPLGYELALRALAQQLS